MKNISTINRKSDGKNILVGIGAASFIYGAYRYANRDKKTSFAKNLENIFISQAPNILQLAYLYYGVNQQARTHLTNIPGTKPMPDDMVKEYDLVHKERFVEVDDKTKVHIMFMHKGSSKNDFEPKKPTVIAHHGIKGNWTNCPQKEEDKHLEEYRIRFAENLVEQGFNVILYSAPGFGKSTGKAGSDSYEKGAKAFSEYIKNKVENGGKTTRSKLNPDNIVVFGESMGTFKANLLLKELDKVGINPPLAVLVAPFESAKGVVESRNPHLEGKTDGWWTEVCDSASAAESIYSDKTKFLVVKIKGDKAVKNKNTDKFVRQVSRTKFVEVLNLGDVGHVGWDTKELAVKIKSEFDSIIQKNKMYDLYAEKMLRDNKALAFIGK